MLTENVHCFYQIRHMLLFDFSCSWTSVRKLNKWMQNGIILFMNIVMCMGSFTLESK